MYTPPAFRLDDRDAVLEAIRTARLATLVTATADGLMATHLPMFLNPDEGERGTLYGHIARANAQSHTAALGEAMVIFSGPGAYISPSWYAAKREHGKVVPTWNYQAIHAYGPAEFFEDAGRLLEIVTRLTGQYEAGRDAPWAVTDAPADYIAAQLKQIIGIRLPITRLDAKRKMSQNRSAEDRAGVIEGLSASGDAGDAAAAKLVPPGQ